MENEACPVFSSVCDEDENDCESNNEAQMSLPCLNQVKGNLF